MWYNMNTANSCILTLCFRFIGYSISKRHFSMLCLLVSHAINCPSCYKKKKVSSASTVILSCLFLLVKFRRGEITLFAALFCVLCWAWVLASHPAWLILCTANRGEEASVFFQMWFCHFHFFLRLPFCCLNIQTVSICLLFGSDSYEKKLRCFLKYMSITFLFH